MDVSTKQQRIAEAAKRHTEQGLTSLNQFLDIDWLREAYRRVRKDSAPGCDGQTVEDYGEHLEENLSSLLERAKSGRYIAPPVRRVHIPKEGASKETRPIGVPTTEDKVLQRAVVMLLEPIFEGDFFDVSFGFRPRRSPHQALEYLWHQAMAKQTSWIIDVDIRKFFDTLDKSKLREMFQSRVRDGVITRLIGKWLKAGVLEQGEVWYPEAGSPQGGVISPLLSNLYLHEVIDKWFATEVMERLHGRVFMVRFADDMILGFELEEDARRVYEVLPKRFSKFGLTLHSEKTRLVPFARPPRVDRVRRVSAVEPGTFDFLGFTHYWGKSRKGNWVIKRKTVQNRFSRALKRIREWCQHNRHLPIRQQYPILCQKLRGHFAYYGITGNGPWLERFREQVKKTWRYWLNRRSRNPNDMTWERFGVLIRTLFRLPPPRVVHSAYT